MPVLHNQPQFIDRRRKLRSSVTPWEVRLWARLKNRKFLGFKFRRQHGIGPYVVDFYCPKLKLAIELDGGHHFGSTLSHAEEARAGFLDRYDIMVIRYANTDVEEDINAVLEDLARRMGRRAVSGDLPWLSPSPPRQRRGRNDEGSRPPLLG